MSCGRSDPAQVAPGTESAELGGRDQIPDPSAVLEATALLPGRFQELWKNEWGMYKPRNVSETLELRRSS
jgi:hypothetical protein